MGSKKTTAKRKNKKTAPRKTTKGKAKNRK